MATEAAERSNADNWGWVSPVVFPDGRRGSVEEIRVVGVEVVGGIVRMPVRHSSRIASQKDAA